MVEFLHDRLDGVVEGRHPVEGAALCRGGAVGVHPVHTVLGNERHKALREFLDGLVEGLGGRVSVLTQHLVLCQEQALYGAHERAALAGEVAGGLALEAGLEEVARAYAHAEGEHLLERASRVVLIDGVGGVEAAAFEEHRAQRGARAFGRHEDDVDVGGGHYARAVAPVDGEAVREVERLAGGEVGLDGGPELHLCCVGEQHADDGAALGGLLKTEERFARHPSVGHRLLIGLALALSHYDIEAVVAQVAGLAGALDAVAEHGDGFVFEHLACLLQRELFAGHHFLDDASKIQFCHFSSCYWVC